MNDFVVNISPNHAILKSKDKIEILKNQAASIEYIDNDKSDRLNKDDSFITLNKNEEYFFQHFGFVSGNPKTEQLSESEARKVLKKFDQGLAYYKHIIPVKVEDTLTKDNLLDEYMFSLIGIKNLADPYIHFRQKVTSLNPNDFETITNQWVYVSRTVFARLVNALPKENRLDFVLQSIAQFNTVDLREVSFQDAILFLRDYIDGNFLSQGRLLIGIKELLETQFATSEIPINELSFINPEEEYDVLSLGESYEANDKIIQQANYFKKLFEIDGNLGIIDKIFSSISQNRQIEQRFNELFRNRPWPIDLRI